MCSDCYDGARKADILFVQECAKTMSGVNGYRNDVLTTLRRAIGPVYDAGMRVHFINLVGRVLPQGRKPTQTDIKACKDMFAATVEKINPKYIITMGATVFKAVTGRDKFKTWVGRVIEIDGCQVIPIFHPDYAAKDKQRQREYDAQLRTAINHVLGKTSALDDSGYELVTDEARIVRVLLDLSTWTGELQAFDYETTHLVPAKGHPVCLSISPAHGRAFCFYWFDIDEYRKIRTVSGLTPAIRDAVTAWMLSPVPKTAHNAKFEIKWTKRHFGVEPHNIVLDTQQTHHLLLEESSTGLKDIVYQYTDMGGYDTPMQDFLNRGHEHWECPKKDMRVYSCGDSDATRRIAFKQMKLIKQEGLTWLERNIVRPAAYTLARIEERGMKLDVERMRSVETKLNEMISDRRKWLASVKAVKNTVAKFNSKNKDITELNVQSSPQIQHLLYNELKLPVVKTSKKTNAPSTDQKVLDQLRRDNKVVDCILQVRSLMYQLDDLRAIREKMDEEAGTVFSDLRHDYVTTGRLSSRSPNLQNIKGDTEEDPSYVKECFVSRFDGGSIVQSDFKQLELTLIASEAGEERWINALENDDDMHSMAASDIYKIPLEDIIAGKEDKYKKHRMAGKRVNFGSVYGITEHGLSKQIDVSVEEAKKVLDAYWEANASIKTWMNANVVEAQRDLLVRSRTGRIRHLSDIVSDKWWVRESAERVASNFKIQSLGADLTTWAMVQIDNELLRRGMRSMVIGQIHDSVLVDAHPDELVLVVQIMHMVMTKRLMKVFSFLVATIKVDVETGYRWSEGKKVELSTFTNVIPTGGAV